MKKINELRELPEFAIDPTTGEKVYRPSSDAVAEWCKEVSELYQIFLQLQKDRQLSLSK
jgi:hypothetical protein